jgi:hypothetical protein
MEGREIVSELLRMEVKEIGVWVQECFFLARFGYGSMMALLDGYSGSLMFFCS